MRSKAITLFVAVAIVTARAGAGDGGTAKVKPPKSYVKVRLDVEIRGTLSFAEREVTVLVQESEFDPRLLAEVKRGRKWTLDLGQARGLRAKAKGLHGKDVIVRGSATLLGVTTQTVRYRGGVPLSHADKAPELTGARTVLDLEHRLEVKSLTEAPKE